MNLRLPSVDTFRGRVWYRTITRSSSEARDLTGGAKYPNLFLVRAADQSSVISSGCSRSEAMQRAPENLNLSDAVLIEVTK